MNKKAVPVGVENFERIIKDGYYYVDKSLLIEKMLENRTPVTLFTRPRRFGKTLNMSMLKYFFDVENNKHENIKLFKNLKISKTEKGRNSKDRDIKNILKLEIAFYDCQ